MFAMGAHLAQPNDSISRLKIRWINKILTLAGACNRHKILLQQ
jgi:hypothetical protein